eukprot:TRINITY_DN2745_c0_g1_i3.p1 TRINITY_DN2745_c0_g1~~TRINITY_DN2745_c0_g1_i3.p1  ORF type:complete len:170 (+),score=42.74 TRINITY_DN2745_c0_g1_i3:135-644(+)
MIRRPPRSTLSSSSAASDVYKRQVTNGGTDSMNVTGASKGSVDSDDDPLNQTLKKMTDGAQKTNEQVGEERLDYVLNLVTRMSDKIVGYQRRLTESHAEIKQLLEVKFNLEEDLVSRGVSPEVFRPSAIAPDDNDDDDNNSTRMASPSSQEVFNPSVPRDDNDDDDGRH